jgi:hypothetical protein
LEATSRNRIVVFELNSQMRPKAAQTLARMVLEDLKHVAGSRAYQPGTQAPFHVYLDEAGRAVYEGFAALISQCRSADIGLTLAAQSPLDFDTPEGKLKTTVLQNTGTKLILRQLDHESAELCANLGGTYETVERTTQLQNEGLLGTNATGMSSEREIDKYIAHPKDQTDCDQAHASSFRGHGGGHDRPAGPPLVREARRGRAPARSGWCLGSGTRWEAGGPALLLDQSRAAASGAGRWGTTGAAGA